MAAVRLCGWHGHRRGRVQPLQLLLGGRCGHFVQLAVADPRCYERKRLTEGAAHTCFGSGLFFTVTGRLGLIVICGEKCEYVM